MTSTATVTDQITAPTLVIEPELVLRSLDATWDVARWETLDHSGPYRYEVIDGVLYMSTSPSPYHGLIAKRTIYLLADQVERKGFGAIAFAPTGLFMPPANPVQPDIMLLRPEDERLLVEKRIETIPLLLVEILSPSNTKYDLVTKMEAYARAGVPEYWVMRPTQQDVLVHSEPDPDTGRYLRVEHVAPDGELISPTLPFRARVADIFTRPGYRESAES
jgi:Uma2 family endonuclease